MTLDTMLERLRETESREVTPPEFVKRFRVARRLEDLRAAESRTIAWRPPRSDRWLEAAAMAAVFLPMLLFWSGLLPRDWPSRRDFLRPELKATLRQRVERTGAPAERIDAQRFKVIVGYFRER